MDCYCDTSFFCSLTGLFDGLLVGDETYACQSFLMTPYPDPETTPQHDFNVALSQTRLKIDTTLAILKARFNCLRDLRVSPERASQIVGACVVLHNIATIRKERVPDEYYLPLMMMMMLTPLIGTILLAELAEMPSLQNISLTT